MSSKDDIFEDLHEWEGTIMDILNDDNSYTLFKAIFTQFSHIELKRFQTNLSNFKSMKFKKDMDSIDPLNPSVWADSEIEEENDREIVKRIYFSHIIDKIDLNNCIEEKKEFSWDNLSKNKKSKFSKRQSDSNKNDDKTDNRNENRNSGWDDNRNDRDVDRKDCMNENRKDNKKNTQRDKYRRNRNNNYRNRKPKK